MLCIHSSVGDTQLCYGRCRLTQEVFAGSAIWLREGSSDFRDACRALAWSQ